MAPKLKLTISALTFLAAALMCASLGCSKPEAKPTSAKQQNLQTGLQSAYQEAMKLPPEERKAYFLQHAGGPGRTGASMTPNPGDSAGTAVK
jgi:hypothetical protein